MTDWELIEVEKSFYQRFACDPPAAGTAFRVLREEWTEQDGKDYRTIYEVRLIDGGGADD